MATPFSGRFFVRFVALVSALAFVGCGGGSALPSSPSVAVSSGATINGTVMSSAPASLAVAVPTAGISTSVASDGSFTLSNVPGGNIELLITGPGLNARITIGRVEGNEVVTITIRVHAGGATLEAVSRGPRDDELRGVVARLAGSCPSLTFTVGQRAVRTNAGTFFRRVTCQLLVKGQFVEVEGRADADGVTLASKVQLEEAQGIERRGAVADLAGSCPNLSFSVAGQPFFTNSTTEFKDIACGDLRNGTSVESKGHLQSNGQTLVERIRPR